MNKLLDLQQKADEYLIVDPAALQIMLLLQLNTCRLHQTVLAAADSCGCIKLATAKADVGENAADGDDFSDLCPSCRNAITEELGAILFYAAALCNAMGLSLGNICELEIEKLDLLGYFMLM